MLFSAQKASRNVSSGPSPDAATTLLLHFDGADNATTTVDSGPLNKTITLAGTAKLSTARAAAGPSSLLLDGSGRALVTAASTDFSPGTGDFAIEMDVYPTVNAAYGTVCGTNSTGGSQSGTWWLEFNATRGFAFIAEGSTYTQAYSVVNGEWRKITVQRKATMLSFWANGTQIGPAVECLQNMNASVGLAIGSLNAGGVQQPFIGNIDEYRFVKGATLR